MMKGWHPGPTALTLSNRLAKGQAGLHRGISSNAARSIPMLRWGMKRDEERSYAGTRVRIGRLAFDETGPRFSRQISGNLPPQLA